MVRWELPPRETSLAGVTGRPDGQTAPEISGSLGGSIGTSGVQKTGLLNDLWKFNLATKQWTWTGGTQTGNSGGTYGVEGTPAAANVPGGRLNSPTG